MSVNSPINLDIGWIDYKEYISNPLYQVDKMLRFASPPSEEVFNRKNPSYSPFKWMRKFRYCAIYKITCICNGRFYIGSAFDTFVRWNQHRAELRNGKHCNDLLQQDYNQYGPDAFTYHCIDRLESPERVWDLRNIETEYIRLFKPYYNIKHNASRLTPRRRGSQYDGKIEFHFSDGRIEVPDDIRGFCQINGLEIVNVLKAANGIIRQHKTVRCKFVGDQDFRFIPKPKGKIKQDCVKYVGQYLDEPERPINNLHQFALTNKFNYSSLLHCAAGKFARYKGWRIRYADKPYLYVNKEENSKSNKKIWTLKNTNTGEIFTILDLKNYCKQNDIKYHSCVSALRDKKQYKHLILLGVDR